MDVSLRHWPIFVTGLLLGAAGTMSLGLQRPTQAELAAAAARPSAVASTPAVPVAAVTLAQVVPDAGSAERADEQMRAAADAFRAQEALSAVATPVSVALAAPPKPRIRRIEKEGDAQVFTAREPSEPIPNLRAATSVMGAAPMRRRAPAEAVADQVQAARGSAHASEGSEARSLPE